MREKLKQLEDLLNGQARATNFSQTDLFIYPETFRRIHTYRLFGNNLLSIPASLIIEGDDDEFEKPFHFTDDLEEIHIFESEFRPEIPDQFVQIGYLYGSTELVLLDKLNEMVHIVHVADIPDTKRLKYNLENAVCDLTTFIKSTRPQTVCCLINPKKYAQYELLEIRNNTTLVTQNFKKDFKSIEEVWKEYLNIVKKHIEKCFQIHYAPNKIIRELNKKSKYA